MILYDLKCSKKHQFEAWFKDSKTYDKQAKRGDIECPTCFDTAIEKAIMAPHLSLSTRNKGLKHEMINSVDSQKGRQVASTKTGQAADVARKLLNEINKFQKHVEDNCEDVGEKFAEEARAIHYGEAEERGIYGEATSSEIEDLADEDISVSQIPWKKRKPS